MRVIRMMIANRSLASSKRNNVHLFQDTKGRERRLYENIIPLLSRSSSTFLCNGKDPIENEKEMEKMDKENDYNASTDALKSMTFSLLQSTLERSKSITANRGETYETYQNERSPNDDNDDFIDVEVETRNGLKNSMDRANDILTKKSFVSDESSSNSNVESSFQSSYVEFDSNNSVCESTIITTSTTTTTTTSTTTMDKNDTNEVKTSVSSVSSPVKNTKITSPVNQGNIKTKPQKHIDKRVYLNQPSVTGTALAHVLWSQVVIPHYDTVIDCTCGNGKDSLILANMLFPKEKNNNEEEGNNSKNFIHDESIKPQLICIDIQSNAISNTTELLRQQPFLPKTISSSLYEINLNETNDNYSPIRIIQKSHDDNLLSTPNDKRSVGLICYNLGWLPGGSDDDNFDAKSISTEHTSTLRSLVDAVLLLRVGGLLSVMTYPGSNKLEAFAVSLFCETLAMFTSKEQKKKGGWEAFIDDYTFDFNYYSSNKDDKKMENDFESLKALVKENLRKVYNEGKPKQTWRVFEHKPMGRPLSPVLVTAMRIK